MCIIFTICTPNQCDSQLKPVTIFQLYQIVSWRSLRISLNYVSIMLTILYAVSRKFQNISAFIVLRTVNRSDFLVNTLDMILAKYLEICSTEIVSYIHNFLCSDGKYRRSFLWCCFWPDRIYRIRSQIKCWVILPLNIITPLRCITCIYIN